MGNKHSGSGYCTYSGSYRQGLFHGYGELCCLSGMYLHNYFQRNNIIFNNIYLFVKVNIIKVILSVVRNTVVVSSVLSVMLKLVMKLGCISVE